ncbi:MULTISPECIES: carboxymuconolactone decarboxylase family protein [Streptosporangium]|uniref:AhpD family alkylhydroperoxidase n=1 Tax=Streptosporangium brasiliense TaxID=47480 RepID=A0ABT9RFV6_9ACTN|nr:carboxymuconolactone decarboxylase family protein [Streptosporangium brasiliense]MDP9868166.1 AhpD family alkylhydroperoxidase [Streptosporangium brasiliense]
MDHERIALSAVSPRAVEIIAELDCVLRRETLVDDRLRELVKIRVSQLNGCAYFLGRRSAELLRLGDTQERLHQLAGWRDSRLFSATERAALALAEAMTRLRPEGVSEEEYGEAERLLGPYNLGNLIMTISLCNALDRMCLAARLHPPS